MPPIYASESSNDPASYYFGSILYIFILGLATKILVGRAAVANFATFSRLVDLIIANHIITRFRILLKIPIVFGWESFNLANQIPKILSRVLYDLVYILISFLRKRCSRII